MTVEQIILIIITIEVTYLTYRSFGGIHQAQIFRGVFIDTSALMDGRIVVAAQSGFTPRSLIVPKSVIAELQLLADQSDHEKRSRARRGLDAIDELKNMPGVSLRVMNDGKIGAGGVDERLITLAKKYRGSICTIDFNLNKVAKAQDIHVLNINELAGSLRMAFLPGETISLPLTQKGQSANQAVGYLADGTMVVVDGAMSQIGKTAQVEFIRSLQTAAGRMMFAKLVASPNSTEPSHPAKKQSGRKLVKQPTATQASTKKTAKKTNEDSLIDLVNNQ